MGHAVCVILRSDETVADRVQKSNRLKKDMVVELLKKVKEFERM